METLSDLYYVVNFIFSLIVSFSDLIVCCTTLSVFICHPVGQNPMNLLIYHISCAVLADAINNFIVSLYGFRQDWAKQQPFVTLISHKQSVVSSPLSSNSTNTSESIVPIGA